MIDAAAGPFFFGPPMRRTFGWLHADANGNRGVGVVLCNPFGFEAICTHRSFRHFAEAFARAGFPALRFDYDGTGDSAGSDRDPNRVRAWIDSVHAAVDVLRERTGVARVCLFGLRLGATLATMAATEREDCAGLIAIVPVVSPALYVRELEALQAWGKLEKAPDGVSGIGDRDQEAAGFVMTAETIAALAPLDLTKSAKAPAQRVLLLERADRAATGKWAERLTALGVDVDARRIGGFPEMTLEPHRTTVPEAMIAASVAWLERLPSLRDSSRPAAAIETEPAYGMDSNVEPGIVETPVFVDAQRTLFGIVARPEKKAHADARAILILNAGAQPRIGPNRMWVTLARHWAQRGRVTLRLDLSGLGDSKARAGERENAVYSPAGTADIADAAAYLRRAHGVSKVDVVGLCGSAYHGFKAAAQGVAIDRVVAINPQVFFWDESQPVGVGVVPANKAASEVARYRQALLKPESWKKLLTGGVKLGAASRIFRKRLVDFSVSQGRRVARRLHVPLENDLATELSAIAKHGVPLRFVFTDGEAGEQLLTELGGSIVGRLRAKGALTIERVRGADHTFTAVWTHRVLAERLDEWLGVRSVPREGGERT